MSLYYNTYTPATFEEAIITFERLWRESFTLIPPFDRMPREECDKFKQWAWEMYKQVRGAN